MTIFNLLLLVSVLVFSFSTESMAAPGEGSSQTVSFDELLLVLQWPTSFCNTHYCDYYPIPDTFTVHGLWLNKNSCPVICPPPNRAYPPISRDLWQKMERNWPDLQDQTHPEYFWAYEYEKHGSCPAEFQNPEYYFQTAIDIAQRIGDVMRMRLKSGLALKMGQLYQVEDFEFVTTANETFFPSLRCNNAQPIRQLHEIVFCTDRDGNPKRCTSKMACSGWFEFPRVPPPAFLPSSSLSPAQVPAFLPSSSRFPPGRFEFPEFEPCSSRSPSQAPAILPSSSRSTPGTRSAISKILPLMLSLTIFFSFFTF